MRPPTVLELRDGGRIYVGLTAGEVRRAIARERRPAVMLEHRRVSIAQILRIDGESVAAEPSRSDRRAA